VLEKPCDSDVIFSYGEMPWGENYFRVSRSSIIIRSSPLSSIVKWR
jgi:hypothetical protein